MLSCFNSRTLGRVRPDAGLAKKLGISVSIHAPWEGCDAKRIVRIKANQSFNSRTLGRVRQRTPARPSSWRRCFNSRTLGRVRQEQHGDTMRLKIVSIHAPWEGCDTICTNSYSISVMFQFTHPGKGATVKQDRHNHRYKVSIHAPWEGCDDNAVLHWRLYVCFNSRTLGRVRPHIYL